MKMNYTDNNIRCSGPRSRKEKLAARAIYGIAALGVAVAAVMLPTGRALAEPRSPDPTASSAHRQSLSAPEVEQRLIIVDQSGSMSSLAGGEDPRATRWDVVTREIKQEISTLRQGLAVGMLSVGDSCFASPAVALPTGSDRAAVIAALDQLHPGGATPLNQRLREAPKMFKAGSGGRRISLYSDGIDSCDRDSVCDIAKELHDKYGIVIDVRALGIIDPDVRKELECIAGVSKGGFTRLDAPPPASTAPVLPSLPPMPLPSGPGIWRTLLLFLGLIASVLTARIVYRQLVSAVAWRPPLARGFATLFGASASLFVFVVLFLQSVLAHLLLASLVALLSVFVLTRGDAAASPRRTR
jgi:hypothetical protein